MELLFPFTQSWWLYTGFTTLVVALLALDLGVFHRQSQRQTLRQSLAWSGLWVGLAGAFAVLMYAWQGRAAALEFSTGYVIELSLSADNLFIFLLIFRCVCFSILLHSFDIFF